MSMQKRWMVTGSFPLSKPSTNTGTSFRSRKKAIWADVYSPDANAKNGTLAGIRSSTSSEARTLSANSSMVIFAQLLCVQPWEATEI